jgi:hypothetical protein
MTVVVEKTTNEFQRGYRIALAECARKDTVINIQHERIVRLMDFIDTVANNDCLKLKELRRAAQDIIEEGSE